jgi:dolichyl-phosphate-mannose--protein O-mannosyl transferase
MAMLLLQYVIYMGVHVYLGSMRVMYLYHYFLALVISFVLVPLVVGEAAARWPQVKLRQDTVLSGIVVAIVASFAFYSPLSFHRPLTKPHCELRNVLQPIVRCQPEK